MIEAKPGLFGIKNSNRDFSLPEYWGKNQFNSSFPIALCCYLYSKGLQANYITMDINLNVFHKKIAINDLFGENPLSDEIYYSFETQFTPYQQFIVGTIENDDIVIMKKGQCLKCFEIKLTALPDNTTCNCNEENYSCELVIRPATIIYLACSMANIFKDKINILNDLINHQFDGIMDWNNPEEISKELPKMKTFINRLMKDYFNSQEPIIIQPIWKTKGKSSILSDDCLDIFVWSNFALINLFVESRISKIITRQDRTLVWLVKMLVDFATTNKIKPQTVIDGITLNVKNDKAFSSTGMITRRFMKSAELTHPRIDKKEIKKIVLGNGHNLLSPERRFDAFIAYDSELFK